MFHQQAVHSAQVFTGAVGDNNSQGLRDLSVSAVSAADIEKHGLGDEPPVLITVAKGITDDNRTIIGLEIYEAVELARQLTDAIEEAKYTG